MSNPTQATKMRAKMVVRQVNSGGNTDHVVFAAVAKKDAYPADGSDEDNTFANWTPNANLSMTITNPALVGTFKDGDTFYVDFTPVD